MGKPFALPAWRKAHIHDKFKRKDTVRDRAIREMETVMHAAVDYIIEHWQQTGRYAEPSLNGMYQVSENFYRGVITEAWHSSKMEKAAQTGKKRLAAPGPIGLPRKMRDMVHFFKDSRYWPKVVKRSNKLTDRLRKQYLRKLQQTFEDLVPKMDSGHISPAEAKQALRERWRTSKSRVNTIFQTETTTYFAKTQVAFFEGDDQIIGFLFDAKRHVTRTQWCDDRHGLVYRPGTKLLRENTPACHWHCYSHLIALANTPYNRTLLEDPERDPSRRKVAPLPPGWRK